VCLCICVVPAELLIRSALFLASATFICTTSAPALACYFCLLLVCSPAFWVVPPATPRLIRTSPAHHHAALCSTAQTMFCCWAVHPIACMHVMYLCRCYALSLCCSLSQPAPALLATASSWVAAVVQRSRYCSSFQLLAVHCSSDKSLSSSQHMRYVAVADLQLMCATLAPYMA
jgi:hypothetical protein